jgi:hypothetical protein
LVAGWNKTGGNEFSFLDEKLTVATVIPAGRKDKEL